MAVRTHNRKTSDAGRDVARKKSLPPPVLDPIITMNAGGLIQSASDSIEHMFGWTPDELYGQHVKVLVPEPNQSSLDKYLDRYRNSSKLKILPQSRMFAAVRKDGKPISIELSMSRADLPANAPAYIIAIIRGMDGAAPGGSEKEGERARMHLLITEQTRALTTANLKVHLTDRLTALGTLAAGLGHDMNSVLLPVRARLNAMEHTGISTEAMGHLTAIRRSITYLQHLSDGLHFLTISPETRSAAAQGETTTNISRWWKEMGTLLRKTVPTHVKFNATFPAGLPDVNVARYLLTQAVLNLLINAGESFPPGRRNAKVSVWAKKSHDGKSVQLGVTDNGRGMTQAIARRAFDLFFTTKSRGMGTGLGLPLVRKVAIRAGGDIELRSIPGKGTSAVLLLPVAKRNAHSSGTPRFQAASAAMSITDYRAASLISQILIGAGVELRAVEDSKPGTPDMWVTQPTTQALASAVRLRKIRNSGVIVLVGAPPKQNQEQWEKIGATVIDRTDNFESIRHILGQTVSTLSGTAIKGGSL